MAHIEKRGPKRWRARYRGPDGKEHSQTFARRTDAEDWLSEVESAKRKGLWVDPALGKQTLETWSRKWLETAQPTLKPATANLYESVLRSRILPALGDHPLASLRASDIQGLVGSMQSDGLSASRTRHSLVVLREMLDAAVRDRMLAVNPCYGVKAPKLQRKEAPYFEPSVVDRIAEATPGPYRLLMRVLGVGGLRFGEAAALTRSRVDLMRRRLLIEESLAEVKGRFVFGPTKSHAARAVPLSPGLAAAFESHLAACVPLEPDALVFRGPKGGPLRYRYAYMKLWRPALESLGLPTVGLHTLRHSAAARLISAGASPKAVQQILGHQSAAFSLTVYGHLFDADLDDLAARLDSPAASPRPESLNAHVKISEEAV